MQENDRRQGFRWQGFLFRVTQAVASSPSWLEAESFVIGRRFAQRRLNQSGLEPKPSEAGYAYPRWQVRVAPRDTSRLLFRLISSERDDPSWRDDL